MSDDDLDAVRRYLLAAGVPAGRVAGLSSGSELRDALVEFRLLGVEPRRTVAESAARLGITPDELRDIWSSVGLPVPGEEPIFSPTDEAVLESFVMAREVFGTDSLLRFSRVFGSSMARITEAAFSLFARSVEDPLVERGGTQLDLTLAGDEALQTMDVLPQLFVGLVKRHALHAIRRLNAAHGDLPTHDQLQLTVGFADLVGSTRWAADQTPNDLAEAVGLFEQLAHASLRGPGRLVKMIGDEAMFVTIDVVDGCRTALTLADAVSAESSLPEVRVGLSSGLVVVLDGDYYGTEVNRAARLVASADPSQIVASSAVAEAAASSPDLAITPLVAKPLAGLGTEPRFAVAAVR